MAADDPVLSRRNQYFLSREDAYKHVLGKACHAVRVSKEAGLSMEDTWVYFDVRRPDGWTRAVRVCQKGGGSRSIATFSHRPHSNLVAPLTHRTVGARADAAGSPPVHVHDDALLADVGRAARRLAGQGDEL